MIRNPYAAFTVVPPVLLLLLGANLTQVETPATTEPTYIGSEVCQACHADKVESYESGTHGVVQDERTPAAKHGCESCHGPGSEHVASGGGLGRGIVALGPDSTASAEERSALCLDCHHQGKISQWHGSVHDTRKIACSDCHSTHEGHPQNLRAASPMDLCTNCHKDVKADLTRPFHHPLREGKMACTDCHNPHGTRSEKLIEANSANEKCYECHAEKRGPFLWQHPVVTEDCMACHKPHGSVHDKLLTMKEPFLCQTCHANQRHPGTLYAIPGASEGQSVYQAQNNRAWYRACQNCHVQVHGSNHPSGKAFLR